MTNLPQKRFPNRWLDFPLTTLSNFWGDLTDDFKNLNMLDQLDITMYEDENNILHIEVPMPGLKTENIEVNLNKGVLWIKGEKKEEEKDKKKKFYRRSTKSYSIQIPIPIQTDEKQEPKASYEDGILCISLNKAKEEESKRITVTKK